MENNTNVENQGANSTSSNSNNVEIDYGKFEEILNKKFNQNQRSMFKSFLQEEYGFDDSRIKNEMDSYKNAKKEEAEKKAKEFEDLNNNYLSIQKELSQERLNNAINMNLYKRGLTDEQIPFISKMISTDSILVDGKVDETKLEESIDAFFKAFPNSAPKKEENKPFMQIGATNNGSVEQSETSYLRSLFGIKE